MKLTQAQFSLIADCFPTPRQHKTTALEAMNGWLYFIKNAPTCRDMPKEYGAWNTFYVRMRRWEKKGIFAKAFARLQELQIVKVDFNSNSQYKRQ